MTLDEILKEIKNAQNIVILTHENPDGDAIGSALGMKFAIEKLNKKADLIMTKYAKVFDFLPRVDEIIQEGPIKKYDLAITVDCATLKILDNKEYFENAKRTIVIDQQYVWRY